MSNEMTEALAAIEGKIEIANPKIPEGKTLIGIRLDRDESRAGKFMQAISRQWLAVGMAVAVKNGHVIRANHVFGRWTNGVPKVTATHFVKCAACGKRVLMPLAVWEAKDDARRRGITVTRDEAGMAVLKMYGKCACGGSWKIDDEGEKEELSAFTDEVLRTFSGMEVVPEYTPPEAFTVGKGGGDLDSKWTWLKEAMSAAGKSVAPFSKDDKGDTIIYNPGFWLGWVDEPDATNLFWVEDGRGKGRRSATPAFDPRSVNGL